MPEAVQLDEIVEAVPVGKDIENLPPAGLGDGVEGVPVVAVDSCRPHIHICIFKGVAYSRCLRFLRGARLAVPGPEASPSCSCSCSCQPPRAPFPRALSPGLSQRCFPPPQAVVCSRG